MTNPMGDRTTWRRRPLLVAGLVAGAVLLAGCSSGASLGYPNLGRVDEMAGQGKTSDEAQEAMDALRAEQAAQQKRADAQSGSGGSNAPEPATSSGYPVSVVPKPSSTSGTTANSNQ